MSGRDISGYRKEHITAVKRLEGHDKRRSALWLCRCDCGKELVLSLNELLYTNIKSCGCGKRDWGKGLVNNRPLVDGTAIDALKEPSAPRSASGVRGVYLLKGRYLAQIKFRKKAYYLGTFSNIGEAAEARKKAEELLFSGTVDFFDKWEARSKADPDWAAQNPIKISVVKNGRELSVAFSPEL